MKISLMIKKLKSVQKNLGDLEVMYNNPNIGFSKLVTENFIICHAIAEEVTNPENKYDITLYDTLDEEDRSTDKFVPVLYIGD